MAVPGPALKRKLQELVPYVSALAMMADKRDVMHGFVPGRSPTTNARQHIGYKYTLTMDLEDFFYRCGRSLSCYQDSKLVRMVPDVCKITHQDKRCVSHHHPCVQGLPTSPAVANLLFSPLDATIHEEADMRKLIYTRYADDMTFSGNSLNRLHGMERQVRAVCLAAKVPVNQKKTRYQHAQYGNRIVTGVGVTDTDIVPTRKSKRKLRAARHQGNESHAAGLEEWCRLKAPNMDKYVKSKLEMVMRRFDAMPAKDISRLQAALAIMEIR